MNLDPFYPIFDSSSWLSRLLPLGIKFVQLRIKELSEFQLRREICNAQELTKQYGCVLVINDYWRLAIELNCDFIHLGQEDLDYADIKTIQNSGIKYGISTHSEQELDRALELTPDYIALGPVYPTILKKMLWEPQGLARVTKWKQRIGEIPLVGIGGLNLDRAPGVFDAGADIVSMVTDITLNPNPEEQVIRWIELTSHHRIEQSSSNT